MVARNRYHTVSGAYRPEYTNQFAGQFVVPHINQISAKGHKIGIERVDRFDDTPALCGRMQHRAYMQIGNNRYAVAVECGRQIGRFDRDSDHAVVGAGNECAVYSR